MRRSLFRRFSDESFEDALARCLTRIETEGVTLDACLAREPRYAAELRPALRAALDLRAGLAVHPSAAFAERARTRMLAATKPVRPAVIEPVPVRIPYRMAGWWRVPAMTAAALALLMGIGGPTAAITSADALPGDWNYGVKRATERVRLAFTLDENDRTAFHLTLADRRAEEIARLVEQGKVDDTVAQVARDYKSELSQATAPLRAETPIPPAQARRIESAVARQETLIRIAVERVAPPDDLAPAVATATLPDPTAAGPAPSPEATGTITSSATAVPPVSATAVPTPARPPASAPALAPVRSALAAAQETRQEAQQAVVRAELQSGPSTTATPAVTSTSASSTTPAIVTTTAQPSSTATAQPSVSATPMPTPTAVGAAPVTSAATETPVPATPAGTPPVPVVTPSPTPAFVAVPSPAATAPVVTAGPPATVNPGVSASALPPATLPAAPTTSAPAVVATPAPSASGTIAVTGTRVPVAPTSVGVSGPAVAAGAGTGTPATPAAAPTVAVTSAALPASTPAPIGTPAVTAAPSLTGTPAATVAPVPNATPPTTVGTAGMPATAPAPAATPVEGVYVPGLPVLPPDPTSAPLPPAAATPDTTVHTLRAGLNEFTYLGLQAPVASALAPLGGRYAYVEYTPAGGVTVRATAGAGQFEIPYGSHVRVFLTESVSVAVSSGLVPNAP